MKVDNCDQVLSLYLRIFIFWFYQFQFTKPLFYVIMDSDLWNGILKIFAREKKQILTRSSRAVVVSPLSATV